MPQITLETLANTVLDQAAQITELRDINRQLHDELAAARAALGELGATLGAKTTDEPASDDHGE